MGVVVGGRRVAWMVLVDNHARDSHKRGLRWILIRGVIVLILLSSSCYCFGARGTVSVVCSVVLSKVIKPFCETLRELLLILTWIIPYPPFHCKPEFTNSNQVTWEPIARVDCQWSIYIYLLLCSSHDYPGNSHTKYSDVRKLTDRNASLSRRVDELIVERDSALQDSQDLLSGMQVRHFQWVIFRIPSNTLYTCLNENWKTAQCFSWRPGSGKTVKISGWIGKRHKYKIGCFPVSTKCNTGHQLPNILCSKGNEKIRISPFLA